MLKHFETNYKRHFHGAFNERNLLKVVDLIWAFKEEYKICVDVISNYVESAGFGLKEFRDNIINYSSNKDKKKFIIQDHYICLKISSREILEQLLRKGKDYLLFQFRIRTNDCEILTEEEVINFEMEHDISQALFNDQKLMVVIKDMPDCLGLRIMYRNNLSDQFKSALFNLR